MKKSNKFSEDFIDSLRTTAENIVALVGKTSETRKSATGEPFVEVAFICNNENDVIENWVNFIKSYLTFAKFKFDGSLKSDKVPVLYWRIYPEIGENDDGEQLFYARLLISKISPIN
jgi:hypothetical protein